tara:strand:- start:523 stop:741 length:219 start_codon:yes stop_codon:yes gene_type:complete
MKNKSYYYTPEEWSRSIGYGKVPEERLQPQPMTDEPYPPLTADQVNQILDELKENKMWPQGNVTIKSSIVEI